MTRYGEHDTMGATVPEGRSRALLVRWRVWLLAALAAGAAATIGAAALLAAPEPVYSTTFVVGGVDMNSTTTRNIAVASSTYQVVANTFDLRDADGDAPTPLPATQLSLPFTGDTSITIDDARVDVDASRYTITIHGTSTRTTSILDGVPSEVLVILDWVDSTGDLEPSMVVSAKAPPLALGQLLGFDDGFMSNLTTGPLAVTFGRGPAYDEVPLETQDVHLARATNLSPLAEDYFDDVYDSIPTIVPALRDMREDAHLSAAFPVGQFDPTIREVLAMPADATVVLEGGLGYRLTDEQDAPPGVTPPKAFDPRVNQWSLSVVLPKVGGASLPAGTPEFLTFDQQWIFDLRYDATKVPAQTEGSTADRLGITASATTTVSTDLFSNTDQRHTASVTGSIRRSNQGTISVGFLAAFDLAWDEPFGLEWVPTVTDVRVEGSFQRTQSGTTRFSGSLLGRGTVLGQPVTLQLAGNFSEGEFDVAVTASLDSPVSIGGLANAIGAPITLPPSLNGLTFGPATIQLGVTRTAAKPPTGTPTTTVAPTTVAPTTLAPPTSTAPTTTVDQSPSTTSPATTTPATTTPATTTTTPATTTSTTTTTVPPKPAPRWEYNVIVSLVGEATVPFVPGRDPLGAAVLVMADKNGITIGARPSTKISISTVLPRSVDVPPEFDMTVADPNTGGVAFGAIISTSSRELVLAKYPPQVRQFFRPLVGNLENDPTPLTFQLAGGLGVYGSFDLPAGLASVVNQVGAQSRVTARGTLPLFGEGLEIDLGLQLRVSTELLPDYFDSVVGGLQFTASSTSTSVKIAMDATLNLRLPAGLPADAAREMQRAGIPVRSWETISDAASCPAVGQVKLEFGDGYRCYDRIRFRLQGAVEGSTKGVGMSLLGTADTPGQEYLYLFGLDWMGFNDLRFLFEVSTDGAQIKITPGLQFNARIGDEQFHKEAFAAGALSIVIVPEASAGYVNLDGISFSLPDGIGLVDVVDLYNVYADMYAEMFGVQRQRIPDISQELPAIQLRNLAFSFSPSGVDSLCISQGLLLTADLYLGDEYIRNAINCDNGSSNFPAKQQQCTSDEGRQKGCLVSMRMQFGSTGVRGLAELAGLDLGPIHWDDIVFDLGLTPFDQHLEFRGGASVDNPTSGGAEHLVEGEFEGSFTPLGGVRLYGYGQAGPLRALFDSEVNGNPFQDPIGLRLKAYFTGDLDSFFGSSELESLIIGPVSRLVSTPISLTQVIADIEQTFAETGSFKQALRQTIPAFERAGLDPPPGLVQFVEAMELFLDATKPVRKLIDNTIDKVLNGVTLDFGAFELEVPGICDTAFPKSEFPGFRNDDGKCKRDLFLPGVVRPLLVKGITEVTGGTVDVDELVDALRSLDLSQPPIDRICMVAELDLNLAHHASSFLVSASASIYGSDPIGTSFQFDFGRLTVDPATIARFGQVLFDGLIDPKPPVTCDVPSIVTTFADPPPEPDAPPPPAELASLSVSETVLESEWAVVGGTFDKPLAAERTLRINWGFDGDGDGVADVTTIVVPADASTFESSRKLIDDDPTGSPSDRVVISVTDTTTGLRLQGVTTALNRPPDILELEQLVDGAWVRITAAEPVDAVEGRRSQVRVTFRDLGIRDSLDVVVDWGDGEADSYHVAAAGASDRQIVASHVWRDDDPTGSAVDRGTLRVSVYDDDNLSNSSVYPVTVRNRAPFQLSIGDPELVASFESGVLEEPSDAGEDLVEGDLYRFTFSFDDVLDDTHTAVVDWGDGTTTEIPAPDDPLLPIVGEYGEVIGGVADVLASPTAELTGTNGRTSIVIPDDATIDEIIAALRQAASRGTAVTGERTITLTHRFDDDDPTGTPVDTVRVRLTVSDDDTGSTTATRSFSLGNVRPEIVRQGWNAPGEDRADRFDLPAPHIEEFGFAVIDAEINDPSRGDSHRVSVDWGDGTTQLLRPFAPVDAPAGLDPHDPAQFAGNYVPRPFTVGHQYGDDGVFTVTFTVTDDDGGTSQTTTTVTVSNVDPTLALDRSDTVDTPGGPTFTTQVGVTNTFRARSTDAGSDDLRFEWAFGDGAGDAETYWWGGVPDPLPSPDVSPVDVTDATGHVYARACLYTMTVDVTDDDGGRAPTESAPVVVVGKETRRHATGWWQAQYAQLLPKSTVQHYSEDEYGCFLLIAEHMSGVMGEVRDVGSFESAGAVLHPAGGSARAGLEADILAAWLNYATGAVGVSPDGRIDRQYAAIVYAVESVALDPTATDAALRDAARRLDDAQRTHLRAGR